MRLPALIVALAALCAPWPAHALLMQISNISDFTLGNWSIGDPQIEQSMNICIYGVNIPALTSYAITASSTPTNFRVTDGSRFISYSLFWKDSIGAGVGTQLTHGVTLTGQQNFNILDANCGLVGPNAKLTIRITQAEMTAAYAGTYNGSITLLLSAN